MNSEFPESPEDRLLDELLQEQTHGPDETFLKNIEAAVDAGPPLVAKPTLKRLYPGLAVAASIALVAGVSVWMASPKGVNRPILAKGTAAPASPEPIRVAEEMEVLRKQMAGGPESNERLDERSDKNLIAGNGLGGNAGRPLSAPPAAATKSEAPFEFAGSLDEVSLPAEDSKPLASLKKEQVPSEESLADRRSKNHVDQLKAALTKSIEAKEKAKQIASKDELASGSGSGSGLGRGAALPSIIPATYSDGADAAVRRETLPDTASGDRYGKFIDQPWKTPDKDPLSTFSIDVDTASYGNVRRMIREGRQIPRDAVRIEECINAFRYNYAKPQGEAPFAVGATLAVCPWEPEHQLVRVAIKGREIEANKRPSSNLVFLIDVSGSMQSPDKLPLLKQSMATLVEQLDERDRVAIVVYAGSEGVALPSTRLDAEGRSIVLKALEKLEAGGSTNGGAGIKRAYELAMKDKIEGGVNRVILATDGDFNVGVTGQGSLVEMVKDRAKSGVYLTVLGFGTGNLNDAMMDAITRDGNGNYFYIDSEREGKKVFTQNLTGTLVTIAKDVKIQVEFNPAKVGSYRLIGYSNRVLRNEDFNNDKVDAGDIGAGHTVTAFYELTPPGVGGTDGLKYQAAPAAKPAAGDEWLTVKLRYKHPDGNESRKIEFPLTGEPVALDQTDADYQFATAAALFGMKLRGMEEVASIGWDKVMELAKPGLKDDATEDRAEFVGLVKKLSGMGNEDLPAEAEVVRPLRWRVVPSLRSSNPQDVNPAPAGVVQPGTRVSDPDYNAVDGPLVRVTRLEDGSRIVMTRTPDRGTVVRKQFDAKGVLGMSTVYRMDKNGNAQSGKVYDGAGQELFRIRYGYRKADGALVEEQMFDSRVKRTDADGNEIPVRRLIYSYDAAGKRGAPVPLAPADGEGSHDPSIEKAKPFVPEDNPFRNEPTDVNSN